MTWEVLSAHSSNHIFYPGTPCPNRTVWGPHFVCKLLFVPSHRHSIMHVWVVGQVGYVNVTRKLLRHGNRWLSDNIMILYFIYTWQWFKKVLLHLNDGKQDPVQQKPDQDVHQIEDKRIPAEQEPDGPRCTGSYYDALRQRLQQNGIRHHGYPQFRPPTNT